MNIERLSSFNKPLDQLRLTNEVLRSELAFATEYKKRKKLLREIEKIGHEITQDHRLGAIVERGFRAFSLKETTYTNALGNPN